jgi:FkbM family methyltransferase
MVASKSLKKRAIDMRKILNRSKSQPPQIVEKIPAIKVLLEESPFVMTEAERAKMTIGCHDADNIPKVIDAGKIIKKDGQTVQIMHNGLLVKSGGYYGKWMADIIKALKGHHEPQEEKVFHEIVKRIGGSPKPTMIELGSFWSYYSLWFNKALKNAHNICCEPDENNRKIGEMNATLNDANLTFVQGAAGSENGKIINFPMDSRPGEVIQVPVIPVDELVRIHKLDHVDLLHMDVQGAELDSLEGARKTIKAGKLRFLMVSTHHYVFSGDPATHFNCADFIESLGGHIIANHTIPESFSGDGLIAASFDKRDKDFTVEVSINTSTKTLFRPYEKDLAHLMQRYDKD